jgi:hypothetical protein
MGEVRRLDDARRRRHESPELCDPPPVAGRVPPHDLDAEAAVLSAVLTGLLDLPVARLRLERISPLMAVDLGTRACLWLRQLPAVPVGVLCPWAVMALAQTLWEARRLVLVVPWLLIPKAARGLGLRMGSRLSMAVLPLGHPRAPGLGRLAVWRSMVAVVVVLGVA